VRPLGVVVAAEAVELGLELSQGPGPGPGGEPLLEGLVEPFHLAAGLGVVGPGVPEPDPSAGQGDLQGHAALAAGAAGEHRAVIAEHGGGVPVAGGGVAEAVVDVAGLEDPLCVAADTDPGVVIQEVEDLHLGVVGEAQWVMSSCQRSLGCSATNRT
jgi:hypothetical protein